MPARRKTQNGKGFFDLIKKGVKFLKDTKAISTIGSLVPHPGAQKVAGVAGSLGFGRKRRRPRKQNGKGLFDIIGGLLGGKRATTGGKRRRQKIIT